MRKNLAYCASRIISAGIVDRNLRLLYRGLQIRMPELDNALGCTIVLPKENDFSRKLDST